ncbi:unnamed protein product [Camellia sinensis]
MNETITRTFLRHMKRNPEIQTQYNNILVLDITQNCSLKSIQINKYTTTAKKKKKQKERKILRLEDQTAVAESAAIFAFGLETQREETETPLALNVHGLYHPSTVRTRPWCCLPSHHPLLFVAHKYQTHLYLDFEDLSLSLSLSLCNSLLVYVLGSALYFL